MISPDRPRRSAAATPSAALPTPAPWWRQGHLLRLRPARRRQLCL